MSELEKEWYEKWFDTNYYHLLYQSRNDEEAHDFISNLVSFLKIIPGSKVIDIACGRGRHAIYLQEQGLDVTGIDIAKHSIEYAKEFECNNLQFHCHDKRKVFKKDHFDFAFNLFTSFGYLESKSDLKKAFQNMAMNLKPGGVFVLDFMNSVNVKNSLMESEEQQKDDCTFIIHKKLVKDKIIKQIEIHVENSVKKYEEKVHLLELSDFEEYCSFSGLKILHIFGDYQLSAFDEEKSERLIVVAQKTQ